MMAVQVSIPGLYDQLKSSMMAQENEMVTFHLAQVSVDLVKSSAMDQELKTELPVSAQSVTDSRFLTVSSVTGLNLTTVPVKTTLESVLESPAPPMSLVAEKVALASVLELEDPVTSSIEENEMAVLHLAQVSVPVLADSVTS